MEDLAVLAATIYVLLGGLALISILLAVLSRRKKLKPWMAIVFNAITGLGAIFGISISWALGLVPLLGLIIGSIVLAWPNRKSR